MRFVVGLVMAVAAVAAMSHSGRAEDRGRFGTVSGSNADNGPGETGDTAGVATGPAVAGPAVAAIATVAVGGAGAEGGCAPWEARNAAIPARPRISASALLTRAAP